MFIYFFFFGFMINGYSGCANKEWKPDQPGFGAITDSRTNY